MGKAEYYTIRLVSDHPMAERPRVTKNVASSQYERVQYYLGEEAQPLSVEVDVQSGVLTYQWYKGNEPIQDATESSFTPPTNVESQQVKYYVEIKNTETGKTPTIVDSFPMAVTVVDTTIRFRKEISKALNVTLPWDQDALQKRELDIEVVANDDSSTKQDAYSIEWYRNTEPKIENAEPLGEGNDTRHGGYHKYTYTIPATTKPGTVYYLAEITCTVNGKSESEVVSCELTVNEPKGDRAYGVIVGEDPVGDATVSIKDSCKLRTDLVDQNGNKIEDPGPAGAFLEPVPVPIYPSDNMMTVVARTCLGFGLQQDGAEEGYIREIIGEIGSAIFSRREFDRGVGSGWMCSLNDWFISEGLAAFSVKNKGLKAGDKIALIYTTDYGKDLQASWDDAGDKNLADLQLRLVTKRDSVTGINMLQPGFDREIYQYEAYVDLTTYPKVAVMASAENKQNKIRIFAGGVEYRTGDVIPAEAGLEIRVVCAGAEWTPDLTDEQDAALAKTYTITLLGDYTLKPSVKIESFTQDGAERLLETDRILSSSVTQKTKPTAYQTSIDLFHYSNKETYQQIKVRLTLTGLPEGASATIAPMEGQEGVKEFTKTEGGLFVELDVGGPDSRDYRLCITEGGKKEIRWLVLKRPFYGLKAIKLQAVPDSSETINGYQEGTLFQLDEEEMETGKTGLADTIYDYNIYVSTTSTGLKLESGIESLKGYYDPMPSGFKARLYVNNELHAEATSFRSLISKWGTIEITDDRTELRLECICSDVPEDKLVYNFHVIRKTFQASDLEALLAALDPDAVEYARDYGRVLGYQELYEQKLTPEQQEEVSPEAVKKLYDAIANLEAQKEKGEDDIDALLGLIRGYQTDMKNVTVMTEALYQAHGEDIRKSWDLYGELTGWVLDQFEKEYSNESLALSNAYKALNRYEIQNHLMGDGDATVYEDDFMVSSNAYNLTMGASETAYPITFRDVINSNSRGGEACLPYNLPGRLQWEIEDESVVTIKSINATYKDMGLGGGSSTYLDVKYYLIPQKPGITTLTVTLTEDAGVYYGQIPKIIIRVNGEAEESIENLDRKLTDIYARQYTTKYDTWHYWVGEEGAPFTFHVNGSDPKVTVLPTSGTGDGIPYPVDANGDVTVLLKDGYNPIVVTAVYEGKEVTQVYGLRGKAISCSITNKYRTGQPLRQGDTAVIKLVGVNTPIHKILRIYNPSSVIWVYDTESLPGQGVVRATYGGGQYSFGYMELKLTGSGTVSLTNGRIEQTWWGSSLYSESDQGNTGEIAPQADNTFSVLPDISFEVLPNENYQPTFRMSPQVAAEGVIKAGDTVRITIPEMPVQEIVDQYPLVGGTTETAFVSAQTFFNTTIPGLRQISSKLINNPGTNMSAGSALGELPLLTVAIPEDTPTGNYHLYGGYVDVKHGNSNWGIKKTRMFEMQIADFDIQVVNPKPGQHTCDWGEGKVTKEATCTEDGVRTYTCSICGETKTEVIPSRGGHKYDAGTEVQPATCVKAGIRMYTCSACGQTKTEQIPATGEHSFDEGKETQAPTCSQDGVRTYTCTVCGETKTEGIPATGEHDFAWTTAEEATVFAAEEQTGVCQVCGAQDERTYGEALKPTIKLNVTKIVLEVKQSTAKLEVSGLANGDSVAGYKSSDKKVFKVSKNGKITAGSRKGKAKLTVTLASGKTKTIDVTVQKTEVKTTKISGLDKKMTIKKGRKVTLKPELAPITSEEKITYRSSNKKVAKVTAKGVVKAKKKGKATITVKSGDVEFKIQVTVK